MACSFIIGSKWAADKSGKVLSIIPDFPASPE